MTRAEEITALYRAGHGQRAISRQIGISQPAVRKHLLRLGLLPAASPSARSSGGDNPSSPLRSGDNPPTSAPQHLELLAHNDPPPASPPPPLDDSLARLRQRYPALTNPPPQRCKHCGVLFHRQQTETVCCFGCWNRAKGHRNQVPAHTGDCRRFRPDNLTRTQ